MFDRISGLTQIITKIFQSKTLIVNWLVLAGTTLIGWEHSEVIAQYPQVVAVIVSAIAFVNLILRSLTGQPLEDK